MVGVVWDGMVRLGGGYLEHCECKRADQNDNGSEDLLEDLHKYQACIACQVSSLHSMPHV